MCYPRHMESERSLASAVEDGLPTTRDALLGAALDGFSRDGFGGTSIRNLAKAVGIRESSVYKHFPSKQAIFDALIELADSRLGELGTQLGVSTSEGASAAKDYRNINGQSLSAIAQGMFSFVRHDPVFSRLRRLMMIEQYHDAAIAQRLNDYLIAKPLAFQTALFEELMKGGEFVDNVSPSQAALAFYGPIFMLMQMGESDEEGAKKLLDEHINGFRVTYLKDQS